MAILTAVVKAAALLTVTTIANAETLVVGGKTYTFNDTVGTADGSIHIGADNTATMAYLAAAINLDANPAGANYGTSMTQNDLVSAVAADETLTATALVGGTVGNLIDCTDSLTSAAWDAAVLGTAVAGSGSLAVAVAEAHARITTIVDVSQVNSHLLKEFALLVAELALAD